MKKIILALAFTVCAVAQQRDTVYLQLASGLTAIPATPTLLVTNNVGQAFHTFTLVQTGAGIQDKTYLDAAQIEAGYDGIVYNVLQQVRISSSLDTINNTFTKYYRVAGAYPWIRIRLLAFSQASTFPVSVYYTGSLTSNPLSDASGALSYFNSFSLSTGCNAVIALSNAATSIKGLKLIDTVSADAGGLVSFYSAAGCTSPNLIGQFFVSPTLMYNFAVDPNFDNLSTSATGEIYVTGPNANVRMDILYTVTQ